MRGGAVAARRAHNPKVAGSSPAPATNKITVQPWSLSLSYVPFFHHHGQRMAVFTFAETPTRLYMVTFV